MLIRRAQLHRRQLQYQGHQQVSLVIRAYQQLPRLRLNLQRKLLRLVISQVQDHPTQVLVPQLVGHPLLLNHV